MPHPRDWHVSKCPTVARGGWAQLELINALAWGKWRYFTEQNSKLACDMTTAYAFSSSLYNEWQKISGEFNFREIFNDRRCQGKCWKPSWINSFIEHVFCRSSSWNIVTSKLSTRCQSLHWMAMIWGGRWTPADAKRDGIDFRIFNSVLHLFLGF